MNLLALSFFFFFFNDTATTEIYTLSLHDALPILGSHAPIGHTVAIAVAVVILGAGGRGRVVARPDRKSTRLKSSHGYISYALFFLKKKKKHTSAPLQPQRVQVADRVQTDTSNPSF